MSTEEQTSAASEIRQGAENIRLKAQSAVDSTQIVVAEVGKVDGQVDLLNKNMQKFNLK